MERIAMSQEERDKLEWLKRAQDGKRADISDAFRSQIASQLNVIERVNVSETHKASFREAAFARRNLAELRA